MAPSGASGAPQPGRQPVNGGFEEPQPRSVAEWEARASDVRATLWRLLGDLPPRFTPRPTVVSSHQRDGYLEQRIAFDNRAGATVTGVLLVPDGRVEPGPAILYNHCHGLDYATGKEELLGEGRYLPETPGGVAAGKALTDAGYVVLATDAYCFSERRSQGPAAWAEDGREREASHFKQLLWEGRTLWGMLVRDDMLALSYLLSLPEVDPARVGATGFSMGSTRSWWLAALDERVTATVAVGCLTRYQELVEHDALHEHGLYYFVPGILRERIDMEAVLGLIAPRPLLTLTGARDAGSPVDGVHVINAFLEGVYARYGQAERFKGVVYPETGHVYTLAMWQAMLDWFARFL
jgi:dienelactone hydrolase